MGKTHLRFVARLYYHFKGVLLLRWPHCDFSDTIALYIIDGDKFRANIKVTHSRIERLSDFIYRFRTESYLTIFDGRWC